MEIKELKNVVEAALLASGEPLSVDSLCGLFGKDEEPPRDEIRVVIKELQAEYEDRGMRLIEVASGFRIQVAESMTPWLQKLWEGRPPRFSRALMETLAITAYRQPLTRGDIEQIRGVSVSTNIIRNLLDRGWIRPVGQRDVPGRPTLYATTKGFLDYFGLKKLEELPPLADLQELDPVNVQLELSVPAEERVLPEGVAPGGVEPLVALAEANELPDEPASVTSLDEARDAAAGESDEAHADLAEDPQTDDADESVDERSEYLPDDADTQVVEALEQKADDVMAAVNGDFAQEELVADADEVAEPVSATVVPIK
jgi:segregation and condensation protein B